MPSRASRILRFAGATARGMRDAQDREHLRYERNRLRQEDIRADREAYQAVSDKKNLSEAIGSYWAAMQNKDVASANAAFDKLMRSPAITSDAKSRFSQVHQNQMQRINPQLTKYQEGQLYSQGVIQNPDGSFGHPDPGPRDQSYINWMNRRDTHDASTPFDNVKDINDLHNLYRDMYWDKDGNPRNPRQPIPEFWNEYVPNVRSRMSNKSFSAAPPSQSQYRDARGNVVERTDLYDMTVPPQGTGGNPKGGGEAYRLSGLSKEQTVIKQFNERVEAWMTQSGHTREVVIRALIASLQEKANADPSNPETAEYLRILREEFGIAEDPDTTAAGQ